MTYYIKSGENFNVFKDPIKNGTVPCVVAMYVPYKHDKYKTILQMAFVLLLVDFFVDPEYNSTCKHFIKSFE